MTDATPLILVLRAAATAEGATAEAFELPDVLDAERRMLIRRFGMEPVWKITGRGKLYLERMDVPTTNG